MLVPRMVLAAPKRGGRAGVQENRSVVQKILECRWEELLQFTVLSSSKEFKQSKNHKKNAAIRLIHCGELSQAARILGSSRLAPATLETVSKLKSKHPPCQSVPSLKEPPIASFQSQPAASLASDPFCTARFWMRSLWMEVLYEHL